MRSSADGENTRFMASAVIPPIR